MEEDSKAWLSVGLRLELGKWTRVSGRGRLGASRLQEGGLDGWLVATRRCEQGELS